MKIILSAILVTAKFADKLGNHRVTHLDEENRAVHNFLFPSETCAIGVNIFSNRLVTNDWDIHRQICYLLLANSFRALAKSMFSPQIPFLQQNLCLNLST